MSTVTDPLRPYPRKKKYKGIFLSIEEKEAHRLKTEGDKDNGNSKSNL